MYAAVLSTFQYHRHPAHRSSLLERHLVLSQLMVEIENLRLVHGVGRAAEAEPGGLRGGSL